MAKDHEISTCVKDGIEVQVDLTWCRSWPGIDAAAAMGDKKASDAERLLATGNYYRHACPNIDEVSEALDAAREGEVTANDVMQFVAAAVGELQGPEQSKN